MNTDDAEHSTSNSHPHTQVHSQEDACVQLPPHSIYTYVKLTMCGIYNACTTFTFALPPLFLKMTTRPPRSPVAKYSPD